MQTFIWALYRYVLTETLNKQVSCQGCRSSRVLWQYSVVNRRRHKFRTERHLSVYSWAAGRELQPAAVALNRYQTTS